MEFGFAVAPRKTCDIPFARTKEIEEVDASVLAAL
jgi:hypothetical protein